MDSSNVEDMNQCKSEFASDAKLTSPLLKNRSSRVLKPNSLIFTSDIEVLMPHKKKTKKNKLLNNAIKTINKKNKLTAGKFNKFKTSSKFNLKKTNLNENSKLKTQKKLITNETKFRKKANKRKYIKQLDEQSTITNLSIDLNSLDNTSNDNISNENKNSINLNDNSKLNYLFNKQPLSKNGKKLGRPRKPIVIDNILNVFDTDNKLINQNLNTDNNNIKNLLEKINESHQAQLLKLKNQLEEKDKEKILLDIKNSELKKENDKLKQRIGNLINESDLRKELEMIKQLHNQEIIEIKKKLWCSNLDCEKQAIYFCCFNAFYCSLECQNKHWYSTHKNSCKNKNRLIDNRVRKNSSHLNCHSTGH